MDGGGRRRRRWEDSENAAMGTVTCLLAFSGPAWSQLITEGLLTAQGTKYISGIRRRLICLIRWAPLPSFIGHTFAVASAADDTSISGGVHLLTSRMTVELLEVFQFQFYGVDLNKTEVMTCSLRLSLCSCSCQ